MYADPIDAVTEPWIGDICDRCNARLRTGETARFYATLYRDGWLLRRVWCRSCGETTVDPPTEGADEVVGEAIWWSHRLAGVRITDRSRSIERGAK